MPMPHEVVDAMAARLQTLLNPDAVAPAVPIAVRAHDGRFLADGKDFVNFPDPCVLVWCSSWNVKDEYSPAHADGLFFALCLARTRKAADGQDSVGDVCMDLAATVTALLESPVAELWPAGSPTADMASKRPYNVRASNEFTNAMAQKGHAAWSVAWRQEFEIDPTDELVLTMLNRIHFTLRMGPGALQNPVVADNTADIEAETEDLS